MPGIRVALYRDDKGKVPVQEWLDELRRRDFRAFRKCVARIRLLRAQGHQLRRPESDYLRDGIRELRARHGHVNYRLLYFFHGRDVAIVAHSLTKEDRVPDAEIERAVRRMQSYQRDPGRHDAELELDDGEDD